ncbi:hypothetical protein KFV05_04395 [Macrococcoides canis]|uniref:hypothetical protein n=1 Tax=Macrococcoides canis TaxID=1855823 RepID=UPI0020B8C90D|nr:hypothetical protein [Macrococcus canis]UTH00869.1 hypothetical protein KFV04_04210 [Macrococcus canis]UTH03234.1 hypothetical protein KFV05_04395 [Macrococcus canis]
MDIIFISTTSKHNTPFIELPQKQIFDKLNRNVLISDKDLLIQFLKDNITDKTLFVIDCETKQGISLFDVARSIDGINCIPYKPNDITLDATDLILLDFFGDIMTERNIGIYGTGNIATKLAIRLAERNANVYVIGRNQTKVDNVVNCINQITFNTSNVTSFNENIKLDCLVSFVSGSKVIDSSFINYLTDNALCLDGGIGNFAKDFISEGNKVGLDIRRVDVRMGDVMLEAHIKSRINNPFYKYVGKKKYHNITMVGGGIIGKENDVIVDDISSPKTVIGLADGFGGVKSKDRLTEIEKERIHKINEYIRENQ